MSKSKNDKLLPFAYNSHSAAIHPMNQHQDIANVFVSPLSIKDVASVMCTMKSNYVFYKPVLEQKKKVEKVLTDVVQGDVISLLALIKENLTLFPSLIFEKYEAITAPRGQTYYNVSTFQLMTFLSDADLKTQAMSLIPKRFDEKRKAQYAEIDCGGADIIKLDRNPMDIMNEQGFEGLTQYKTIYTLYDGTQKEVSFPLLENPEGIICYQDEHNEKHFFYANQKSQSIQSLDKCIIAEESKAAFEQFKKSFDAMENNSGRRSSEKEHQLIAKALNISLVRKGILYQDKGILYRDNRTPFNIVNAYRKCIRLYEEAENNNQNDQWETAHQSWRRDVGQSQGEEIWLLQRICEENKPFHPFKPELFADFKRGCMIYNYITYKNESVFENGVIKMADFALYKWRGRGVRGRAGGERAGSGAACDLVAICWLIEDAKEKVMEFKPEQGVQLSCTIR